MPSALVSPLVQLNYREQTQLGISLEIWERDREREEGSTAWRKKEKKEIQKTRNEPKSKLKGQTGDTVCKLFLE